MPEARNRGAKKGSGAATTARLKAEVLKRVRAGDKNNAAMEFVERSYKMLDYWRNNDPQFAADFKAATAYRDRKGKERQKVPDFPEFCETYLGMRLFWHQLQWFDILEGREPRDLHPSQTYSQGTDPHLLLVNTPPGHSKSTTITAAYTLWRLMDNPNSQIVIISKNEPMAKKWMFQIQDWLTSRSFEKLQTDFGPEEGFYKTSPVWTKTQIYFGSELREENAKDPTLEVLGMHGTIYGARADLIILDDCVDTDNAHDIDNQIEWLTGMVLTRPSDQDKVLVVGTRVAGTDLYRELLNPDRYDDGESPWTYFAQPAVLEFADKPENWVTLWPRSNMAKRGQVVIPDADGLYPKWDGPSLARMRKRISTDPRAWPLKYQQENVSEDAVFPREDIFGCTNKLRKVGRLDQGTGFHGSHGTMADKYVIAGLDPASAGFTAAVCYALNRDTGKRFVLDVFNKAAAKAHEYRDLMIGWTEKYGVREWRVEKVLLHQFIMQDREITQALTNRGCVLNEHQTTGQTKWDADAGIMSLPPLFRLWESGDNLISLPNHNHEGVRALVEQLVTYYPVKGKARRPKDDCLMALWFAEVRARELVRNTEETTTHIHSWFDSESDLISQGVLTVEQSFEAHDQINSWWSYAG